MSKIIIGSEVSLPQSTTRENQEQPSPGWFFKTGHWVPFHSFSISGLEWGLITFVLENFPNDTDYCWSWGHVLRITVLNSLQTIVFVITVRNSKIELTHSIKLKCGFHVSWNYRVKTRVSLNTDFNGNNPLSSINLSYYKCYADVTIRQYLVTCTGFLIKQRQIHLKL